MLNERERRELDEIERAMRDADPDLDTLFRRRRASSSRGTLALFALVAVLVALALGLVLLGLVLQALMVLAVAAWPATVLRGRRTRPEPPGAVNGSG